MAALVATVFSLLLAEAGLRALGYQPRRINLTQYSQDVMLDAPGLPYLYKPNSAFVLQWPSNPSGYFAPGSNRLVFYTNNAGFRGPDFSLARNSRTRVAMIGDSLGWGQGVKEEHTASRILERELNRVGGGDNFEVYNFCLTSYQTADEVELFERVVLPYRPDVVVVWFFLNDFFEPGALGGWGIIGNRNLGSGARERSVLLDTFLTPVDEWVTGRAMVRMYREVYRPDSPQFQKGRQALARLKKICGEQHIIPVLAIHPILYRLDESYGFTWVHQLMVKTAGELEMPVVDMLPWFLGRRDRELWVHPTDWHPNQIAHAIAGEEFAKELMKIISSHRVDLERTKAARIAASALAASESGQ